MPSGAKASATCHPSLSMDNHMQPTPGATITVAPLALAGSAKKGVRVAWEIFRAIGSPHWRNQVSGLSCPSTPPVPSTMARGSSRSEEHTSELQSRGHLVCRLLLEKKKNTNVQE